MASMDPPCTIRTTVSYQGHNLGIVKPNFFSCTNFNRTTAVLKSRNYISVQYNGKICIK